MQRKWSSPSFACKMILIMAVVCFVIGVTRLSILARNQLSVSMEIASHEFFHLPPSSTQFLAKNKNIKDKGSAALSAGRLQKLPVITKPNPFPPLHEIVQTMKGNSSNASTTAAQYILDIAIIGFAKCGTSTMMYWLGEHPEIKIPPAEITALKTREPWEFVVGMYQRTGTDPHFLRGYKSPNDITDLRALRLLREYWPQTKIIVGIRHPVHMMESFYNHRVQNGYDIRSFDRLKYNNLPNTFGVHFSRTEYHVYLAQLGKTDLRNNPNERALFPTANLEVWNSSGYPVMSPNPIFLYDTTQLSDSNTTRLQGVLKDLQNFLGLTQPLPPPLHERPGQQQDSDVQKEIDLKKINVCDARYQKQRQLILRKGAKVQAWIRQHFLSSPSVYVSNREHFRQIVKAYGDDLCGMESLKKTSNGSKFGDG